VMKILTLAVVTALSTGCGGISIEDQIQASSEGRALERMADNLSNKATAGNCSIIRTGGMFYAASSVSISCP
jgi:hypothetical protein